MKDAASIRLLTPQVWITRSIKESLKLNSSFHYNPAAYHIRRCPVVEENDEDMEPLTPEQFEKLDAHDRTVVCKVCIDPHVELHVYPPSMESIWREEQQAMEDAFRNI